MWIDIVQLPPCSAAVDKKPHCVQEYETVSAPIYCHIFFHVTRLSVRCFNISTIHLVEKRGCHRLYCDAGMLVLRHISRDAGCCWRSFLYGLQIQGGAFLPLEALLLAGIGKKGKNLLFHTQAGLIPCETEKQKGDLCLENISSTFICFFPFHHLWLLTGICFRG